MDPAIEPFLRDVNTALQTCFLARKKMKKRIGRLVRRLRPFERDLRRHAASDATLLRHAEAATIVRDLHKLVNRVQSVASRVRRSRLLIKARFKKRVKRLLPRLDTLLARFRTTMAYLKASRALKGIVNLSVLTGHPEFESLDATDADKVALAADRFYFGHGVERNLAFAYRLYSAAANLGDVRSMYTLGNMCFLGRGCENVSQRRGMKWWLRAAEGGSDDALNSLGQAHEHGCEAVARDLVKAAQWYRKASASGKHADAMVNLASLLVSGEGVVSDAKRASSLLHNASLLGSARARNLLGTLYYHGNGVERSYERAVEFYRKAADRRNVRALNNLAICYERGRGVPRDLVVAGELYALAADAGNSSAMANMGFLKMLRQEYGRADNLLHDAAERGSVEALYSLALLHARQDQTDFDVAAKYLRMAADAGHVRAIKKLADMAFAGGGSDGAAPDFAEAKRLYARAAELDDADASNALGLMYEDGSGCPAPDATSAARCYRRAARRGSVDALCNLALLFWRSAGDEKDRAEARRLLEEAAKRGHTQARDLLHEYFERAERRRRAPALLSQP